MEGDPELFCLWCPLQKGVSSSGHVYIKSKASEHVRRLNGQKNAVWTTWYHEETRPMVCEEGCGEWLEEANCEILFWAKAESLLCSHYVVLTRNVGKETVGKEAPGVWKG